MISRYSFFQRLWMRIRHPEAPYGKSSDGPTPPPCNSKIFKKGEGVCVVYGSSNAIERWVKAVAKKADAKVDWHFSGGLANVLHLGNNKSRLRVLEAIKTLESELDGKIMSIGGPARYRSGVDKHRGLMGIF